MFGLSRCLSALVTWKSLVSCFLFLVLVIYPEVLTSIFSTRAVFNKPHKKLHYALVSTTKTVKPNVEEIMKNRLQEIRHQCLNNENPPDVHQVLNQTNSEFIIVDDVNKVMFCYVSKAGNSHWKAVMAVLGGAVKRPEVYSFDRVSEVPTKTGSPIHAPWFFKKLDNYDRKEAERMLRDESFMKFMVVRHPFSRLLSAYQDKFALRNTIVRNKYKRLYGNYIIRKYQKGNLTEAQPGYDVSWKAFAEYVSDSDVTALNEHWELQNKLCNPCAFKYDFVSHLEQSDVEAPYWLEQLKSHTKTNASLFLKEAYDNHVGYDKARKYFSQLSSEVVLGLYERYKSDFELFGYKPADVATSFM